MLNVRMLTKRWYKLWNLWKDLFKKEKKKEKNLYTEKKFIIKCVLLQSTQWVKIVSDFEKCWFGVLVENVYFTWNICVLSILTLAITPQQDPVTLLNSRPIGKGQVLFVCCFKKEICACMHVWSGIVWDITGQCDLFQYRTNDIAGWLDFWLHRYDWLYWKSRGSFGNPLPDPVVPSSTWGVFPCLFKL